MFPHNFQIDFTFSDGVPESLVTAAGLAANLWQSVIIGIFLRSTVRVWNH